MFQVVRSQHYHNQIQRSMTLEKYWENVQTTPNWPFLLVRRVGPSIESFLDYPETISKRILQDTGPPDIMRMSAAIKRRVSPGVRIAKT
jgi:hypothetical protein